jgi:signal transduction histidine kinase
MSVEFLRRLPLLAGLPEADLDWLFQKTEPVSIHAGDTLIEEGSPGDALYIVVDGEFEITKRSGQHEIAIALRAPGEVIGEMALLDRAPRSATVRALRDSRLLKVPRDAFDQLLSTSPSAALAILHTVMARLRQNESLLHEREKMAGLGTLAAGLAHELNNPAAAARRGAAQLREALAEWERLTLELNACGLTAPQAARINTLREEIAARAAAPIDLDPLARSDRESDIQMWLEDHGVDQAWELAPTLASFGWDMVALGALADVFSAAQISIVAPWLGAGCSAYALLDEVGKSAERISEIVKAVKSYSYLDQAPIQEVDVHEGLDNTLVILRHKLKQGVRVTRNYAAGLPRIEAYASELNQVWTNIIDNAVDAMNGQGELVIRTLAKDGQVVVEIADNGPGIPPQVQSRIFEPFFTTKPPGVGTGLGLNIAYNIVQKHLGQIKVTSQPGATCFQVMLPIQLKRGER